MTGQLAIETTEKPRAIPSAVCGRCGRRRPLRGMIRSRMTGRRYCGTLDLESCAAAAEERKAGALLGWLLFVRGRWSA